MNDNDMVLLAYAVSHSGDGFLTLKQLPWGEVQETVRQMHLREGEYAVLRGEVLLDKSITFGPGGRPALGMFPKPTQP